MTNRGLDDLRTDKLGAAQNRLGKSTIDLIGFASSTPYPKIALAQCDVGTNLNTPCGIGRPLDTVTDFHEAFDSDAILTLVPAWKSSASNAI